MMRLVLDGALDGYALPDNHWTARYPNSHIASSIGRVERPGEDVIFLVSAIHQGQLYIAGQGQNTGKAWFWNGGWQHVGTTYGVSPCAFGQGCLYVVIGPALYQRLNLATGESVSLLAPFGSQGVRYIDEQGNPISGDSTYRDGERFEWTARGDLTVYQGHETGAWINGGLLEPGDCRFVRFERRGDELAVALTQLEQTRVVLHWLTVQDIANLPTTVPIDPPPPPPPPPPEPTMQGITDAQYETLKAERAKITNSVLTPEQIGTVLNATAWKHRNDSGARLGLQAKPSGTSSIQPRTGTKIWNGLRIIDKDGKHWGEDVCGGCSVGQFNPVRATPGPADPAGFVAPVEPIGSVPDPPPPPPPPPEPTMQPFDIHTLILHGPGSPDIRTWRETTSITEVNITNQHEAFRVRFTAERSWPRETPPGWDGGIQYTLGMTLFRDGAWHGAMPIECWDGEDRGFGGPPHEVGENWFESKRNPSKWGPLDQPRVGEWVGMFVVRGAARLKDVPGGEERSNVVLFQWPAGPARFTFPTVTPPPPPPPPAGDLEELKAEVLFLQAGLKQQAVIVSALSELATDLTGRVKVLELKPPPVATLPKLKIISDPSAAPLTTSREWSHAHTLRLKLEQE